MKEEKILRLRLGKGREIMKNKLILLIILCIGTVFMLSACGGDNKNAECEHAYVSIETNMSTCMEFGSAKLACTLCGDIRDVQLDVLGHDFNTTFEWTDDNAHASALLECKRDSSHVYNVSATIKEETKAPTCTEVGKQTYTATVTWNDKEFTDVKEYNLGLGECTLTYTFDMHGENCTDGFDMTSTCTSCQKTSYASFDSHVLFDMARFTVCGGEAVVSICPCGENVDFKEPTDCTGEVELETRTETGEDGTVYTVENSFCLRCGFELVRKTHVVSEGCYSYYNRETQIVDGETVFYTFYEPSFEITSFHELVYSYDGDKIDSCENGYTYTESCKVCSYTATKTASTHDLKFDGEKIDLDTYEVCGGYFLIKKCPCEAECELGYSLFCDYEYTYEDKIVDGEIHTVKSYVCENCNMEFIYDEYIKNAEVFGLWRLTVDGEVKYELECAYK